MAKDKKQKQKTETPIDPFSALKSKIKIESQSSIKMPSILDFVENKEFLGLTHSNPPIHLFDLQKLVLKCFYRGSDGNENLTLSPQDILLIEKNHLNEKHNGSMLDKWNSGNHFRELVLVWGRRCLSESSEIIDTKTGKTWQLGDLWNFGQQDIGSWTYDEQTKKMTIIEGCNLIYQGKRDVFKIQTNSGHEIEATDNHPMMTESGWVEVKNLRPKDKIAISSCQPFFGDCSELSEEDASFLGYLSSNCFDSTSCYISTTLEEGSVLGDFKRKALLLNPEIKVESSESYNIKSINDKKYNYVFAQKAALIENKDDFNVVTLLKNNGLKNKTADQKFVPTRIFSSPKKIIASYLKSLFSCDAVVRSSKLSRFSSKIEISVYNLIFIKQIQHLLSRFGIFSSFASKTVNKRTEYVLSITKNSHVRIFVEDIGLISKDDFQKEVKSNTEYFIDCDSIVFVPIFQIRKVGVKKTFDLQVSDQPHLQNFVCNGFICHNSGKDFLTSIIALYEAMRLLETPGGNPYKTYNLASATPFTILTIANSSTQAQILFREIKDKVLRSEYFKDKIIPEGVTSDAIHFLTPEDKRRNEELIAQGHAPGLGSIVVKSGHSNSDSLVGISCYVLLLDEIGLYKNTAGSSSGDAIYNSLGPAVKTYVREVPKLGSDCKPLIGENGETITEKIYDGKIVCLSTPRGKGGIFFDLYNSHEEVNHRLVCRAATWQVNPMQTKEGLMASFPDMPEEKFSMEFGAEFSGTAGVNFFNETDVDFCFQDKSLKFKEFGTPGMFYFAHLDPATSSHNYALVLAHKEVYFDFESHKREWKIIVDHIKYWSPSPNNPISLEEVDNYVADLNFKFCIGLVTYDHFNSQTSIVKLRKKGIPTKMTAYTKQYKNIIYDNLYQLVIQKRLFIPNHLLLKNEMKNLQRKYTDSGYRVYPKKDGDVTTDDITDALAGACYNCIEKELSRLPQGKLVSLPVNSVNDVVWRSMSGQPYGVGSGQQVAKKMEERSSLYRRGM